MKLRLLLLPLVVFSCATPAPVTPPAPTPTPAKPDDDRRLVSREEFHSSPWQSLGPARSWTAVPGGIALVLADGRPARLEFAGPSLVRWWVPSGAEDTTAPNPGAAPAMSVQVRERDGAVLLETPSLTVRFRPSDLSWTLVRGEKTVLQTRGGPLAAGRRMALEFEAAPALRWAGPGLETTGSARFWLGQTSEGPDRLATPALVGVGGPLSLILALDNPYQTYTRVASGSVRLGALNGGLNLLAAASLQPAGAVEALTAVTGRPSVLPQWAFGTSLVLPQGESGAFVRKAKLSVQTAVGPAGLPRVRFQTLHPVPIAAALPDLTAPSIREAWVAALDLPTAPGTGLMIPAPVPRSDWAARFDDGGRGSPLARINNQMAGIEAQSVAAAWQVANQDLRPYVLAAAGSWGTVRSALPLLSVVAGQDGDLPRMLSLGASGFATPAVRLDLTPLATPATRASAFQSLLLWGLAPVLTLDWGPSPAEFWTSLPEADRQKLKGILDRRSQFKPLFAQAARMTAQTGRPAWQPLWYAAPTDPQAAISDEFLVGDLLVAPVLGGAAGRNVYLPGPGVWFDFWTGEEWDGGKTYPMDARSDRPLLFARGGGLVPVRETEAFDEKDVYNPLTVHVFPGGRGTGTYYLDDGRTQAWRSGVYWETRLLFDYSQKEMALEHQAINTTGSFKPDPYLLYRIHNVYKPRQVKIDGKAIPLYGDSWGITDTDRSAAWYEGDHTLLLKTFRPEKEQSIVIGF